MPRAKKQPTIVEQLRRIIGDAISQKQFTLATELITILEDLEKRPEPEKEKF